MPLYWRLLHVLPWWYTHLLNKWEGARRPHPSSVATPGAIWALLHGRKVPIQISGSWLSQFCYLLCWNLHGVRLHIRDRRLAQCCQQSRDGPVQSSRLKFCTGIRLVHNISTLVCNCLDWCGLWYPAVWFLDQIQAHLEVYVDWWVLLRNPWCISLSIF